MERSAVFRSLGRIVGAFVPSRASLCSWAPSLIVGIGFGLAAQIAEAVLPSVFGASWPSWGAFACSAAAPVLAVVTILTWSFIRDPDL